jgi:hypothetical protein
MNEKFGHCLREGLDPVKGDIEIKVLVDCMPEEMQLALTASNRGGMSAVLLSR